MADIMEEPGDLTQSSGEMLLTSEDGGEGVAVNLWDLSSCYSINSYKGETPAARTLALLTHDYIVYAAKSRPALWVHSVCKKDQVHLKLAMPGLVSVLAVAPRGDCLVAAVGQNIYLWQVWSGSLMAQISNHLGNITCLRFTQLGNHFVSADAMGCIMAWSKTSVVEECLHHHKPSCLWRTGLHAGPVTDLHVGSSGSQGTVVSSSEDHTCRIWDLVEGQLLYTLIFDAPISAVTMDLCELLLFAGDHHGRVFVTMIRTLKAKEVHINADTTEAFICREHKCKVTFLAFSHNSTLVSGGDKQVLCGTFGENFDMANLQTIEHKGEVSNVLIPDIPLNCNESNPRLARPPPFSLQLHSLDQALSLRLSIGSTDPKLPEEPDCTIFSQQSKQLSEDTTLRKEVEVFKETLSNLTGYRT